MSARPQTHGVVKVQLAGGSHYEDRMSEGQKTGAMTRTE